MLIISSSPEHEPELMTKGKGKGKAPPDSNMKSQMIKQSLAGKLLVSMRQVERNQGMA